MVAWLSGSALVSINEVTLRQARLVLGSFGKVGSKGRCGSLHLWINMLVACKTV